MEYVLRVIGIAIIVIGTTFTLLPQLMPAVMEFVKVGKRVYGVAALRIVLGGLLIWCSQVAMTPWVPLAIGILMVVSAIVIFSIGLERVHRVMGWIAARPELLRRTMTLVVAMLGAAVILAA